MNRFRPLIVFVLAFVLLVNITPVFAAVSVSTSTNIRDLSYATDGNIQTFAIFDGLQANSLTLGGLTGASITLAIAPASHSSIPMLFEYLRSDDSVISQGSLNVLRANPFMTVSLPAGTVKLRMSKTASYYQVNLYEVNPQPVIAPTNVNAVLTGNSVTVTWTASTSTVSGYNVYRNGTKLNSSLVAGTSFTGSLTSSGTYEYIVRSVNAIGVESTNSLGSSVIYTVPATPLDVLASLINKVVTVTWTPSATPGVIGYDVYRDSTKLNASLISEYSFSYSVTSVGSYNYRVKSVHSSGTESAFSSISSVSFINPEAPTSFYSNVSGNGVVLTWTPSTTPGVVGYSVFRDGLNITTSLVSGTSFSDINVFENTYIYTIRAVHQSGGESPFSDSLSVTYIAPLEVPKIDLSKGRNILNSSHTTITSGRQIKSVPVYSILPYGYSSMG